MTKHIFHDLYLDSFEYHGNTTIEVIRKQGGRTVLHDWLIFDSVEEATEYFNDQYEM